MSYQKGGKRIFGQLIRYLNEKKILTIPPGQLAVEIGRFFLGKPYVVGTLETREGERFIVNLREFDCVTFVENVIALATCVESRQESFAGFLRLLRRVRYRNGQLQGYSSRLHYFSDWIHDNQKKGFVRNITADLEGKSFRKAISFMTTSPGLYPPLKNALNLRRMKSIEKAISKRSLFYIPKTFVRTLEDRIHDGDVIAITANTEGLDVQHVGFAIKVKNRIHLLHASRKDGKVVISKQTLYRHLVQGKARSGIMVARLRSGD